jgi:hypothetical protein
MMFVVSVLYLLMAVTVKATLSWVADVVIVSVGFVGRGMALRNDLQELAYDIQCWILDFNTGPGSDTASSDRYRYFLVSIPIPNGIIGPSVNLGSGIGSGISASCKPIPVSIPG